MAFSGPGKKGKVRIVWLGAWTATLVDLYHPVAMNDGYR
jgi:hypothetical protein